MKVITDKPALEDGKYGVNYEGIHHADFSAGAATSMVHWKRSYECPNGASELLTARHWSPRHKEISIVVREQYETDAHKLVGKEAWVSLDMEAAKELRDYLDFCITNHEATTQ